MVSIKLFVNTILCRLTYAQERYSRVVFMLISDPVQFAPMSCSLFGDIRTSMWFLSTPPVWAANSLRLFLYPDTWNTLPSEKLSNMISVLDFTSYVHFSYFSFRNGTVCRFLSRAIILLFQEPLPDAFELVAQDKTQLDTLIRHLRSVLRVAKARLTKVDDEEMSVDRPDTPSHQAPLYDSSSSIGSPCSLGTCPSDSDSSLSSISSGMTRKSSSSGSHDPVKPKRRRDRFKQARHVSYLTTLLMCFCFVKLT